MKVILTESQVITLKRNTQELDEVIYFDRSMRRYNNPEERYKFVADEVIKYMDEVGFKTIPTYNTLVDDNSYRVNFKTREPWVKKPTMIWKNILEQFLNQKEYDTKVKPLIAQLRPEYKDFSSFSKAGAKNHVLDGLLLASLGEVIVYNTFKMNGIILEHEPKDQIFTYTYIDSDGIESPIKKKKPDFYWREKDMIIEVAGFRDDGTIAKDYSKKISAAKDVMDKQNKKYVILDYYPDRNNKPIFFKLVCETFNFNYKPEDYPKVVTYEGVDRAYCEGEVKRILSMSTKDTTGAERARVSRMMKDCLSKTVKTSEGTEEVPYKSGWELRDDLGYLRRSSPEVRDKVQQAWCKSPYVSAKKVAITYNEMYDDRINHNTVDIIMGRNKEMFDKNNKESICSKFNEVKNSEEELDERGRTLANTRKKRLFPKSAMMANPLRFKEYDKERMDIDEVQTRTKKLLGKGREREVYLSHIKPNLVFKLWTYDGLVEEKELFDKYPNLFVKIGKVRPYENPHYSNIGYAVMERVDTVAFKQEVRKLYSALENVGYKYDGVFGLIDGSRNEKKYDRIVNDLNNYDPSTADFFIKLRDCALDVERIVGSFFDRSFDQFGLDNDGNVKCFDI